MGQVVGVSDEDTITVLEDRGRYEFAEQDARLRKWGRWQDDNPVSLWDWRASSRGRRQQNRLAADGRR